MTDIKIGGNTIKRWREYGRSIATEEFWEALGLIEKLAAENAALKAKLKIAVEALEWYSDPKNYVVHIDYDEKMKPIKSFNPISEKGERAREALAKIGDEG